MWFCFPSQEGKPEGGGQSRAGPVNVVGAEAVGLQEPCPSHFTGSPTPSSTPGLGNRRGRSRTRLFCLGSPGWVPRPGREVTESWVPHMGASWMLCTAQDPPTAGNLSIPALSEAPP